MNITIRKATPEDAKLVADIGRSTFYETWKSVNTEEDLQMYLKEAFDDLKIQKDIERQEVNTFLLAFDGNDVAGYVKLRNDRNYKSPEGMHALELERIYVSKKYQDKKVGKSLMDESIEIAKRESYAVLWLGVNQDNSKAINFYKMYGFEIVGTKQFKLGTAIDEDYLMQLVLSKKHS